MRLERQRPRRSGLGSPRRCWCRRYARRCCWGANRFVEEEEAQEIEFHPYREEDAARQLERLRKVRAERDGAAVAAALDQVRSAARAGENVMPSVMDAVESYATVGEVCGALKEVFGTFVEPIRF